MKLGKRTVRKMQLLGFEEYYLLDLYKLVDLVSLFFHRLLRIGWGNSGKLTEKKFTDSSTIFPQKNYFTTII